MPRTPSKYNPKMRMSAAYNRDYILRILNAIYIRGGRRTFYVRNIARSMRVDGRQLHHFMPHLIRCGAINAIERKNMHAIDGKYKRIMYRSNIESDTIDYYLDLMQFSLFS